MAMGELGLVLASLLDEVVLLLLTPVDELAAALASGLGVLDNSIRRKALAVIADQRTMNRKDLASELVESDDVSSGGIEPLVVRLHHIHLPKLDDSGIIEYDSRSGDIVLRKDPTEVKSLLESV